MTAVNMISRRHPVIVSVVTDLASTVGALLQA